ncbi:MAG: hypothetical protein ACRD0D_06425, partial [Acidimicrobiales bacterium]
MTRGITTALAVLVLTLAACGDPPAEVRPGLTMTTAVETTAATTTTTQAASTTVSPKTTAAGGGTAACETVGFTPNTEDAASSITATGVSCAEARAFV